MPIKRLAQPTWLDEEIRDVVRGLENNLALAKKFIGRSIRVRRRGFRPSVKRGDVVQHAGKMWNVSRRSNWHLWLYEHVGMTGATTQVRLPQRYEVH